jgi:hypothetical protein
VRAAVLSLRICESGIEDLSMEKGVFKDNKGCCCCKCLEIKESLDEGLSAGASFIFEGQPRESLCRTARITLTMRRE